jgi:hypothetical protein
MEKIRSRYVKMEVLNKHNVNVSNKCINLIKYEKHAAWCNCHIKLKLRISNSNCGQNECRRSQSYEFDDLKCKFTTVWNITNKIFNSVFVCIQRFSRQIIVTEIFGTTDKSAFRTYIEFEVLSPAAWNNWKRILKNKVVTRRDSEQVYGNKSVGVCFIVRGLHSDPVP